MRMVPVARRSILADRKRFAISTLSVGLAVALILLLQGLWVGTLAQVSAYTEGKHSTSARRGAGRSS